jgi:transketolase
MQKIESNNVKQKLYCNLIDLVYKAKVGHIGSCLSCLDLLYHVAKIQCQPGDKFILSKGHAAPALYIVLNELGEISDGQLQTFHTNGTKLATHPTQHFKKCIPFPTGSLGHGLSLSCGIAQVMKYKNEKNKVFCIISDGECNCGQLWEAAQYASAKKLDNLIVVIDKNKIQAFGKTKEVLGDSASAAKWKAFGFNVLECDGHKDEDLKKIFNKAYEFKNKKPTVIIAKTIKGHGISFMENKIEWHYWPLNEKQYKKAITQIKKKII